MYENLLKNFKIDDFWNDCLDKPYSTNFYKEDIIISNNISADVIDQNTNINSNKLIFQNKRKTYLSKKYPKKVFPNENEEDNNIKSKFILKTKASSNDLKNIKEALLKEELIPLVKEKKSKNNNKIFINLYKKEKIGRDLRTKNNNMQKEQKEKMKIEECTFKPEKCKNKKLEKKINNLYKNTNIYERNIRNQQKHKEKMAYLFNETNKVTNSYKTSECHFQPYINVNKNFQKILYDENNMWKSIADNVSNKLFLLRYMKAREEEFDKQDKLNNCSHKKIKYNFSYPKNMVRSLSQKDSLIMREKLHNTLYSFKNLFTDEDDNNKNNEIKIGNCEDNNIEKENNKVD